jgi:hypothetical protein
MKRLAFIWKAGPIAQAADILESLFCHDAHYIVSKRGWQKLTEVEDRQKIGKQ